ncbi:MAG TPA: MFS transporter [Chloroflexota bacterium]|nr:MFS transporter [Chloroflexota bacterium]
MDRRSETKAVYTAGVVQGIALVTFPAISTVLTSPDYYGLSNTAFGAMFVPQAVTAIAASLLGGGLSRRWGLKRVYLLGLVADLVAMAVLLLSQAVMTNRPLAYGLLLLATASLGAGFGLTVPSLNTFAAAFFPAAIERAVLILNALLGLGTALAPVFAAVFVGLGIWRGLPLLVAVLLLGLLAFSLPLPLRAASVETAAGSEKVNAPWPARFWVFAGFALLYGIVETMNGNWATIYMTTDVGASSTLAALALTAFWGMVTVGRVLFAAIERRFPAGRAYHLLPFVAAGAFVAIAALPPGAPALGVLAFGLAGLGCSALLPLTIGFGQEELAGIGAAVAGGLIAFYQVGYGLAAFGVGPLERFAGLSLSTIYGWAAVVALALGALSFVVVRRDRT